MRKTPCTGTEKIPGRAASLSVLRTVSSALNQSP